MASHQDELPPPHPPALARPPVAAPDPRPARTDTGVAIALRGVTKTFHPARVLRGVDLDVAAGETVALLGANGAGKTTLLRSIATLLRPDAGTIRVAGIDARRDGPGARARLAFVAQDPPLFDELTVLDHLGLALGTPAPMRGVLAEADLLTAWGLQRCSHRTPLQLSRGQRQRVALACAFGRDADVLLLDEPFTALDEAGRVQLEQALAARRGRKATLVTLHDAATARRLATRTLRLVDGVLDSPESGHRGGPA